MIQFGPAALKCHIKLRPSPEKWSVLAQGLLSLSAELFCVLVLSCRSDGDPRCMNTHASTHTPGGLPYGKQSSGRGNEACVNSIVPLVLFLAASGETTEEGKRWGGGMALKDDCHGRMGGSASVWLNGKMPCVNVITFSWM